MKNRQIPVVVTVITLAAVFPTWFDTTYFANGLRRAEQRHSRQAVPA